MHPVVILLLAFLASCSDEPDLVCATKDEVSEKPMNDHVSHQQNVDSIRKPDLLQDTISCLDISFIEKLESAWESSYKDARLIKKGFSRTGSPPIENGKELVFENLMLKNRLVIAKSKHPEGEITFSVVYTMQTNQLECFTEQLMLNNYTKDQHVSSAVTRFKKKGLGSYESKIISVDSMRATVSYEHYLGKELSLPARFIDSIK